MKRSIRLISIVLSALFCMTALSALGSFAGAYAVHTLKKALGSGWRRR